MCILHGLLYLGTVMCRTLFNVDHHVIICILANYEVCVLYMYCSYVIDAHEVGFYL